MYTENGAKVYESTGRAMLDMSFKLLYYRKAPYNKVVEAYHNVLAENLELGVKFAFYLGDIREGLGERRIFRIMLEVLYDDFPDVFRKNFTYIAGFNRWKTVLELIQFECKKHNYQHHKCSNELHYELLDLVRHTLMQDIFRYHNNKSISLLAKWMPSLGASNKEQKQFAGYLRKHLNWTGKEYRKILKQLRAYLDVVEVKMSSQEWDKINYDGVPSKANLIYKDAFLRHDSERRTEYLNEVSQGKKKINSNVLYPHEIVKKYWDQIDHGRDWDEIYDNIGIDQALELLWESLSDSCPVNNFDCLVVSDGSGSMCWGYNSNTPPLIIAQALSIYCAENLTGDYQNCFISFSQDPKLINLQAAESNKLRDKLRYVNHVCNDCSNTDIYKVFKLILDTAIKYDTKPENLPKNIMIISDMGFDDYSGANKFRRDIPNLFSTISLEYQQAGYKLPRLICWNVDGKNNGIPMIENEHGVVLISGFSTNLLKMVLNNEIDPYKNLTNILNGERYSMITV